MRTLVAALALFLALPTVALAGPSADAHPVASSRYSIVVGGETAFGYLAYPTDVTPTTLLVFGHGCCGKPDQSGFVASYAAAYGIAVVAMDYRGPGGWDVMKGSADLVAATRDLQSRFPITHTVIWGMSMGGETTGMAVAQAPTLYDQWVDTFGVTDLFTEFVTLGTYPCGCTSSWMIAEAGGTPATAPHAYADRSPVLMGAAMKGLGHAYLVHGIGDPIVPYSESREMYAALLANGIPASFTTVTTGGGCTQLPYTPAGWPPCAPTPVGPAAHDGRGAGPSYGIVDQLLRGIVPDAGAPASEHVVDYTTGQSH